uniref:Uncharacterized protein n=1 Tax=Amphimedon queenslandica TaxID=400682 RepID=A0A1X7UYG4_AMPQE
LMLLISLYLSLSLNSDSYQFSLILNHCFIPHCSQTLQPLYSLLLFNSCSFSFFLD